MSWRVTVNTPHRQHEAANSTLTRAMFIVRPTAEPPSEPQADPPRMALSLAEAATALGLSRRHVENLVKSGQIPSKLLGRRRLIPVAALTKLLEGDNEWSGR